MGSYYIEKLSELSDHLFNKHTEQLISPEEKELIKKTYALVQSIENFVHEMEDFKYFY